MTYKEFVSKLEEYSFCMLNFEKESEECLILYLESEVPVAALSLVDDTCKFLDPSVRIDTTFLRTMAEPADTHKEQRGDWE